MIKEEKTHGAFAHCPAEKNRKTEKQNIDQMLLDGLDHYWKLYEEGLKKQANQQLNDFLNTLEHTAAPQELEHAVEFVCRGLCDDDALAHYTYRGNGCMPHALSRLVWDYLERHCRMEQMPQMRWAYQLYGRHYNPFDPEKTLDLYRILEKAYAHPDCDPKTVELYLNEQISWLEWGAHHFPEGCIIAESSREEAVCTARQIMAEHTVDPKLKARFENAVTLYQCYHAARANGNPEDFYRLCEEAGIPQREHRPLFKREMICRQTDNPPADCRRSRTNLLRQK